MNQWMSGTTEWKPNTDTGTDTGTGTDTDTEPEVTATDSQQAGDQLRVKAAP